MNKLVFKNLIKEYNKERKKFSNRRSYKEHFEDIELRLLSHNMTLDDVPDNFTPNEQNMFLQEYEKAKHQEQYEIKIQNAVDKADEKVRLAKRIPFFRFKGYRQAYKILKDAEQYLPNGICYEIVLERIDQVYKQNGFLKFMRREG